MTRKLVQPEVEPEPPTVNVFGDGVALELPVWTACWGRGYCFDGFFRPKDLKRVQGNGPLYVEFPVAGWGFTANTEPVGVECGRSQTGTLAPVSSTVHELIPQGPADEYYVDLFGRGPGGDVFASFIWETTVDGRLQTPTAGIFVLSHHDGRVDSYGAELWIRGLAATPNEASATVTVTAANGASTELPLVLEPFHCAGGEGRVRLTAPREDGLRAAALGEAPFTYEVELLLDGSVYEAVEHWPGDEVLDFEPALPALVPGGTAPAGS